jgi:hypothetical protein
MSRIKNNINPGNKMDDSTCINLLLLPHEQITVTNLKGSVNIVACLLGARTVDP